MRPVLFLSFLFLCLVQSDDFFDSVKSKAASEEALGLENIILFTHISWAEALPLSHSKATWGFLF